ncbi:MAG: hypothetical protein ABII82_03235 [Verrucomicrobiota bacterium]
MGGGVGSVDADKHTLHEAVLVRPGEALGHDLWIDSEFCAAVAERANAAGDKGLKARFGHPNMCSEALGTFLGRWKGLSVDPSGRVVGDLHLSSTAAESPKGDLRNYVEVMAAKEPLHFGASVVFTRDEEAENEFMQQNGLGADGGGFRSPDPQNARNLPHARCAELHAADLVDDPAATDGMFSGLGGASLAAEMTEWLDTHPGVLKAINDEPELLTIVERYADELRPFLTRYTENLRSTAAAAEPATASVPEAPAEPDARDERIAALEQALGEQAEVLGLTVTRAETAEAQLSAVTAARDESVARCDELTVEIGTLKDVLSGKQAECDEAQRKLRAIEAGAPPVSAKPGEATADPWKKAQRSTKQ